MRTYMSVFAIAGLAVAMAATPAVSSSPASEASWQGQGQGRGRGGDQGNGRGKARGQPRSRGEDAARAAPGQGRGRAEPPGQQRAQSRGQGRGEARAQVRAETRGPDRGRGNARADRGAPRADGPGRSEDAPGRARRGRPPRDEVRARVVTLPEPLRRLSGSRRRHDRLALAAVTLGSFYGLSPAVLRVRSDGDRLRIRNDDDLLLLDLDESRARDLGAWELRRLGDRRARADGPAFCRSGEGHPVWGREWCLEKGFGLGGGPGRIWTRGAVDDVVFRRPALRSDGDLDWEDLAGVLGLVALDRLGLHALSLGYTQPLTGVWVVEPEAPRLLRVRAGSDVIAEFVDRDRDDRAELLYVLTLD